MSLKKKVILINGKCHYQEGQVHKKKLGKDKTWQNLIHITKQSKGQRCDLENGMEIQLIREKHLVLQKTWFKNDLILSIFVKFYKIKTKFNYFYPEKDENGF